MKELGFVIHCFELILEKSLNPEIFADKEDSGGWRKKLNFSFVQVEDSSLICLPWAIACLSQTMI